MDIFSDGREHTPYLSCQFGDDLFFSILRDTAMYVISKLESLTDAVGQSVLSLTDDALSQAGGLFFFTVDSVHQATLFPGTSQSQLTQILDATTDQMITNEIAKVEDKVEKMVDDLWDDVNDAINNKHFKDKDKKKVREDVQKEVDKVYRDLDKAIAELEEIKAKEIAEFSALDYDFNVDDVLKDVEKIMNDIDDIVKEIEGEVDKIVKDTLKDVEKEVDKVLDDVGDAIGGLFG
jgi:F0F1-type ATP synthase membrane subunit b/b'